MTADVQKGRWVWCLILVPYFILGALVPLSPETPYSDDFDYAATAWHLANSGILRLSDWPTTMLAGHACWGAIFCKLGGNSYFMLRLSVFALSAATALALYAWSRRCGHSRAFSVWCGVTFAVNPLTVSLEYTFLTDITGAALGTLLVLLGRELMHTHRSSAHFGYGMLGGFAYLSRQTAAIPYVFALALTARQVHKAKGAYRNLAWMLVPFLVGVLGFRYWLTWEHGVPMHHRFQFLQVGNLRHHGERLVQVLLGLGLQLTPLAAVVLAARWSAAKTWPWKTIVCTGLGLVVLAALTTRSFPTPYAGEVFDLGLHALEFPSGEIPRALRGPIWTTGQHDISLFKTVALATAVLSTLVLVSASLPRAAGTRNQADDWAPSLATLSLLANGLLLLITWVYVDRYLVALVPLSIMVLAERLPAQWSSRIWTLTAGWVVTAAMGMLSLVGIQDGMQRSATFWDTVRQLHALEVSPHDVDAGLAYGGFYRYNPTYRGPHHVGPYLEQLSAAQREYMRARYSPLTVMDNRPLYVSFGEADGYDVVARRPFHSWLRAGEVLVQLRKDVPQTELRAPFVRWLNESGGRPAAGEREGD